MLTIYSAKQWLDVQGTTSDTKFDLFSDPDNQPLLSDRRELYSTGLSNPAGIVSDNNVVGGSSGSNGSDDGSEVG